MENIIQSVGTDYLYSARVNHCITPHDSGLSTHMHLHRSVKEHVFAYEQYLLAHQLPAQGGVHLHFMAHLTNVPGDNT